MSREFPELPLPAPQPIRQLRFVDNALRRLHDQVADFSRVVIERYAIQGEAHVHCRERRSLVGVVKGVPNGQVAGVASGQLKRVADHPVGYPVVDSADDGLDGFISGHALEFVGFDNELMNLDDIQRREEDHGYLSFR